MSIIGGRSRTKIFLRKLLTKKNRRSSLSLIMNSSAIALLMFSKIGLSKKWKLWENKSIFNLKFKRICLESASHTRFKYYMKKAKSLQRDSKTYHNKYLAGCCKKMTICEGNTKINLIKRPQLRCFNNIILTLTKLRLWQPAQI